MNWTNIKLILLREVRDQLRDRRMLFMMFVLPVLLYPFMGLSITQLAQFLQEHPTRVVVVGAPNSPDYPPLIVTGQKSTDKPVVPQFSAKYFDNEKEAQRFHLETPTFDRFAVVVPLSPSEIDQKSEDEILMLRARQLVDRDEADVVVIFPVNFESELEAFHTWIEAKQAGSEKSDQLIAPKLPSPRIYRNTAKEKSLIAFSRVQEVLYSWQAEVGRQNFRNSAIPLSALKPFEIERYELAEPSQKEAAAWSKILPMMLIIWALTGAFYPAIDLCAGEKERGTLETLLCSPASREEIVTGKIITVMLFSLLTSLLNLLSIGATGLVVMNQLSGRGGPLPSLGMPPIGAMCSMAIALVPIAILFSALTVALASYARSNKEGQYYLMPLMLVVLPLVFLPLDPRMELTLGNALIPVTGLMLLLRNLLEGEYVKVLMHVPPVLLVTSTCCWIAIRWAVEQFNREEVLFRESERFELKLWLKRLFSVKQETPTVGLAVVGIVAIFLCKFLLESMLSKNILDPQVVGKELLFKMVGFPQLIILIPVLILAFCFTTRPAQTFLLPVKNLPQTIVATLLAVLLAWLLVPTGLAIGQMLKALYPVSIQIEDTLKTYGQRLEGVDPYLIVFMMSVVPAIVEELAFRGYILSGLRHWGSRRRAIVVTAVCFGLIHGMLHQSINAAFFGLILGYLAIKSNSIWPCIAFHATNNATQLAIPMFNWKDEPWLSWMLQPSVATASAETPPQFQMYIIVIGILAAGVILSWFGRLPLEKTKEEAVWDQINENSKLELT